jgi:protein-disulfide isomerase
MAFLVNRRSLIAAVASCLAMSRPARAKPEQAFDIATPDGAPIRNFRIAPGKAPSDLPGVIRFGPPNAELVLYEFFDYACPYCRVASQELDILLGPDAGAKLGLLQHPILSPRSVEVARIMLAATLLHGDAVAYRLHVGLFQAPGSVGAEKALAVAAGLGLDAGRLAEEAAREEVAAILAAQTERARALSLPQTPSFVLGDFAFVGWPGVEPTESFIEATRRCGGLRCPSP